MVFKISNKCSGIYLLFWRLATEPYISWDAFGDLKEITILIKRIMDGHPIFWVVDQPVSTTIKYWMPIHYDTIKNGQKKISSFSLILSWNWVIFAFYWQICQKCYYKFTSFHLNNYTPYENKCFNPSNQIHGVAFVMRVNSVCVQMRHRR